MGDTIAEEHIVMTPTKKGQGHTAIRMERMKQVDKNNVMHIAGGDHKGIIINKEVPTDIDENVLPQLLLEFKVFLKNASTDTHSQESRQLKFWFKDSVNENEQMRSAQDFFKELISPCEFPRDYVGFIKKIMKLMQGSYTNIKKIDVEMKQLESMVEPPIRPASMDESMLDAKKELSKEKLLELIESSYPTPVPLKDMAESFHATIDEIQSLLDDMVAHKLIKNMENDTFTRITQDDTEVKMVKQMPTVISSQQPTIAIITAQYCEKLAVDSMIENKDTYVRYKTEGESNVYTLGNIGAHRVVSTKLPTIGHSRSASIAAGNTTTRLLGIFQKVEYVLLVGVGGGVCHYTDYTKHVRQGDVVVSCPGEQSNDFVYMFCEKMKGSPIVRTSAVTESDKYSTKTWRPLNMTLQNTAQQLWNQAVSTPGFCPWADYVACGLKVLEGQEADFCRPPADTDKLYMSIGEKDLIEVSHPVAPDGVDNPRERGLPVVHFGVVGSARTLMRDDSARMELAQKYGLKCFVPEFDSVVESIYGNRKENYMLVRGISDYKDGTTKKEWQPSAALNAAAFVKAVICALDPCDDD